jgi:uncharacterized repeat protein (TIGR01451 family)
MYYSNLSQDIIKPNKIGEIILYQKSKWASLTLAFKALVTCSVVFCLLMTSLFAATVSNTLYSEAAGAPITGSLFTDFNRDGKMDYGEKVATTDAYYPTGGIVVTAYDDLGNIATGVVTNSTTGATYSIDPSTLSGSRFRVQFTLSDAAKAAGWSETVIGTDSLSSITFVNAGGVQNFGVIPPSKCPVSGIGADNNTNSIKGKLWATCFQNGDRDDWNGSIEVLKGINYDKSGKLEDIAAKKPLGSIWGLAYDEWRSNLFTSGYLKSHTELGPEGLDGLYWMTYPNETVKQVSLETLGGPSFGTIGARDSDTTLYNLSTKDASAFPLVAKQGIGDIDISADGRTLFVTNILAKTIQAYDVSNAQNNIVKYLGNYQITNADTSCPNVSGKNNPSDWYPFGLEPVDGDSLYVGITCNAQTSQSRSDLTAKVLELKLVPAGTNNNVTPVSSKVVHSVSLDYYRPCITQDMCVLPTQGNFQPWEDDYTKFYNIPGLRITHATPVLADINIAKDGSLVLNIMDRSGDQFGDLNHTPGGVEMNVNSGGDLLKVCNTSGDKLNPTYVTEGYPGCAGTKTTGNGPNGAKTEFFEDGIANLFHTETTTGGSWAHPYLNEVVSAQYDPINDGEVWTGGLGWMNNATGTEVNSADLFIGGIQTGSAGKSNGIGDVEGCVLPVVIGDYVWLDTDKDGIQDPSEQALAGVSVTITGPGLPAAGVVVKTDANGRYEFSSSDGLLANNAYTIRFDPLTASNLPAGVAATALIASPSTAGTNTLIDSNINSSYTLTTAPLVNGIVNHSYDAGFIPPTILVGKVELIKSGLFVDSNADGAAQVGETIKYSFTVKNTGQLALSQVTVTDNKCTPVLGGPIATLAIGAIDTTTFTCTYALTLADINLGRVDNSATVTAKDSNGATVTDISDSTDPAKPGLEDPTVTPLPAKLADDFNTTPINTPVTYSPLANDKVPAGSKITGINGTPVVIGTPIKVPNGTVVVNADGTITVTPDPGYVGDIKFPYEVTTPNGTKLTANDTVTITGTGKLELIKSGAFVDSNSDGAAQVGEKIKYTFTVKNSGVLPLTNVTVTDNKCSPIIGGPINLAVGASDTTTFSCTYSLTAADLALGRVDNSATVTGKDPLGKIVVDVSDSTDPNKTGQDDPTTVPLLSKLVDDIKQTPFNTPITYSPLENDLVPPGSKITAINGVPVVVGVPIKVPNGTVTLNSDGTVTVTPDNGFVGDIKFPYEVTTPNGTKLTANDTVTVQGFGKIELIKAGAYQDANKDGVAQVGETIKYIFSVKNTGSLALTNVMINDNKCSPINGGPINLAIGASDSTTFNCTYVLTLADIKLGRVDNSATVTGKDPNGKSVTDTSDSTDPNKPGLDDPTVVFLPVKAVDDIKQTTVNTPITYSPLENDSVPTGSIITSINGQPVVIGKPIPVVGGTVTVNADGTVTVTPNPDSTTTITFPYEVTTPSGIKVNAVDTITILKSSISLDKEGTFFDANNNGVMNVGELITYTFKVTNTGNTMVKDIKITDPLPGLVIAGGPIILNVGQTDSTSFTAKYPVTQADIDAGSVKNQATATGKDPNGKDVTAISNDPKTNEGKDPTIVPLPTIGKIELLKVAQSVDGNGNGYSDIGDYINYYFAVKNVGSVTLTNVTVTDNKAAVVGGPIAILAPGEVDSKTFTAKYMITQADLVAGKVENSAVTRAKDPKGKDVSDISDSNDKNQAGQDDPTITPLVPRPVQPTIRTGAAMTFIGLSVTSMMIVALLLLTRTRKQR